MHIEENQFQSTLYMVFQTTKHPNLLSYYWSIKGLWHLKLFIQKIMILRRKWMNYYIIIKTKCYAWNQECWKRPKHLVHLLFFTLLRIKVKIFQYARRFPTINVTKKVERANQNKKFPIRKPPLIRKILGLNCSFWNSLRGKKYMLTHTLVCIHYLQHYLHLSSPIRSACTYLTSHVHFDGYEQASTPSIHGTECLMHIQCLPEDESFDENLENKY